MNKTKIERAGKETKPTTT